MSGAGPVEPGEGTRAWDLPETEPPPAPEPPHGRFARLYAGHRRAVLAAAVAVIVLAGGGYLYATRPKPEPEPEAPYPSQATGVSYLGAVTRSPGAPRTSFGFEVEVSVRFAPRSPSSG